jgi:hypothetical protein
MKFPNGDDDTYVFVEHCHCISCNRIRQYEREAWGPDREGMISANIDTEDFFNHRTFRFACERCGCKRCPHHSYNRLRCTGSNEPGQRGSIYE